MAFIWPMPVPYGFLIIAVVVKWLSFRIKGVEWYAKVIVTLAAGMLLGWGTAQVIYEIGQVFHQLSEADNPRNPPFFVKRFILTRRRRNRALPSSCGSVVL